jgi:hypothetical protein
MMVQRGHARRVAAQHVPLPTPQQRVVAVDPAAAVDPAVCICRYAAPCRVLLSATCKAAQVSSDRGSQSVLFCTVFQEHPVR